MSTSATANENPSPTSLREALEGDHYAIEECAVDHVAWPCDFELLRAALSSRSSESEAEKRLLETLTTADILAGYDDPNWEGFGYLGAISARAADTDAVAAAHRALLDRANGFGWTRDMLLYFLNSKPGRWYGEDASGVSGWLGATDGHTAACCAEALTVTGEYGWAPGRCVQRGQHRP